MAVDRNRLQHDSKSPLGWTLSVACLYLVLSTASGSLANGERLRHHHMKNQLEKTAVLEASSKMPLLGCPNCLFKHDRDREKLESDKLRLEAIKRQILQKLGLRAKPNVTHSLPKEVVMATLSRAEDGDFTGAFGENPDFPTTSEKSGNLDTVEADDFYGRTSEIISFAEQGSWVNQNRLLQFQVSPEAGSQMGQEFRVREASLWLKADLLKAPTSKCRSTDIFVFKIISNRLPESVTLSSKQFDRLTAEPIAVPLEEAASGWQKIDVTQTVSEWLGERAKDKLSLFVDCSCCAHWRIHLFNEESDQRSNPNRPFLVIHTDPSTAKRVRRRAIDCSLDSGNQCCKQRFYVSFKALGWEDWVIAPQGYFANYCRGDCGQHRTPDTFVTYHTHVIEEVRKTQHLSGMTPCCAPLKFSTMSLIYYGPESTIIKRDLPKMVVEECGCP
ncbi:inhibin beta chain [Dendroctonus ponderosae]|uniref:inhibin beta chain n=1 Tax=Dendroctonus ponderosae TaxID=77166 RepID=UPI002034C8DF|nr:inhibin beta chain [Dendroctonus ponderosae]